MSQVIVSQCDRCGKMGETSINIHFPITWKRIEIFAESPNPMPPIEEKLICNDCYGYFLNVFMMRDKE
jgi:hypothetical protein